MTTRRFAHNSFGTITSRAFFTLFQKAQRLFLGCQKSRRMTDLKGRFQMPEPIMTDNELKAWVADELTCPWCGYECRAEESFDVSDEECEECGKAYRVTSICTIDHTSEKMHKETNGKPPQ